MRERPRLADGTRFEAERAVFLWCWCDVSAGEPSDKQVLVGASHATGGFPTLTDAARNVPDDLSLYGVGVHYLSDRPDLPSWFEVRTTVVMEQLAMC